MMIAEKPKAMSKPKVVLSDHAHQRCRESGISPSEVVRVVQNLPAFRGIIKWRVPGRFAVVVSWKNGVRLVVTVIAHYKQTNYRRQTAGWFCSTPRLVE